MDSQIQAKSSNTNTVQGSRFWAAIAYLMPLAGAIIAYMFKRDDRFVKYHAMQGVGVGIIFFIIQFAIFPLMLTLFYLSPFAGIYSLLLLPVIYLLFFAWIVHGLLHVFHNEEKPVFLIGRFIEGVNI